MKILYDGLVYSFQAAGGISRYFNNVISRLPADCEPLLITSCSADRRLPNHPNLKIVTSGRTSLEEFSWKLHQGMRWLEKKHIEHVSLSRRFDVAHPTYYNLLSGREISDYRCPVVVTVYDMIHELLPGHTVNSAAEVEGKRRAIFNSDAIICISENTKKDLLKLYAIPEKRVSVIHLASGIDKTMAVGNEPVPSNPYYLYVGERTGYKNFHSLLRAFVKVANELPNTTLCIVGNPVNRNEQELIAELNLMARIQHYHHVTDSHLAKLYHSSVGFVYPSLYEGFGIPLLEAMACGTAVIASDCSSIPEVVGDAALLFDPRSEDDLAAALRIIGTNEAYRESLIAKGYARAQMFSWDKTVAETLSVYQSL